jgi:hypothetical protein
MVPKDLYGHGRGRGGPGRRRGRRRIESLPGTNLFGPLNAPPGALTYLELGVEHVEVLRLCDIEGLTQQEAAEKLGVSRRTLWTDLKEARSRVARALTEGKGIRIVGQINGNE